MEETITKAIVIAERDEFEARNHLLTDELDRLRREVKTLKAERAAMQKELDKRNARVAEYQLRLIKMKHRTLWQRILNR